MGQNSIAVDSGAPFLLWKFRSMYQDAEKMRAHLESSNEMQEGVTFKVKNDPRVTKVGKLIRKLSLDEIPQLWNVLKGEMSLVGPRPALYSEIEKYSLIQRQRLDTIPGLTSDWVIAGRSKVCFTRQAELDIDYVHHQSLWRDIKLIFKTIPSLLSGQGAY
ncbi:sugar transferase [Zooshikella ganghwensis]|uniref:sugar transferase n=1 Tax=Zooshikella ganghwensis TaxID=202772 RepID=UPI00068464E1|nr:sugar transferase [Zooshikella ganghwensis]